MNKIISHLQKHWKNYLIALLFLVVLSNLYVPQLMYQGVGTLTSKSMVAEMAYDSGIARSAYYPYPSYGDSFAPDVEERMIIKNGNVNIETRDYDAAKNSIHNLIKANDGIILNENENEYNEEYRIASFQIKVDSTKFDSVIEQIQTYGDVLNVNVYSNDVTGTYTDYTERISRYESQIETYKKMLEKEANIEEEVQIQQRIDQLEDQIYYLSKSQSNLGEKVQYSELYISLKEKPSLISELDFLGIKDAFKVFLNALSNGIKMVLMVAGFILPFGLVYYGYRLVKRKR